MRYVQCVLGITVDCPQDMSPQMMARAHADAAGQTVEAIRADILSPAVAAAIGAGFTLVATRRFRAVVNQPTGVVVTVEPPYPLATRRVRITTDAEHRRERARAQRRSARGMRMAAA